MEQILFVTMNLNEILIYLPATSSQLSLLKFHSRFLVCIYYKMQVFIHFYFCLYQLLSLILCFSHMCQNFSNMSQYGTLGESYKVQFRFMSKTLTQRYSVVNTSQAKYCPESQGFGCRSLSQNLQHYMQSSKRQNVGNNFKSMPGRVADYDLNLNIFQSLNNPSNCHT